MGREPQYIGGLISIDGHVLGLINIVVCLFSPLFEVWVSRSPRRPRLPYAAGGRL